jgi:predicted phosphodiesterase
MRSKYLSLVPALVAFACSSGQAPAQPDSGTAPGGEGGAPGAFSYTPAGCMYTVTPPASRAYVNEALDDTTAVDPTMGAPNRVRLGLGGTTTAGQPGYPDITTTATFTWETAEVDHAAKVKLGPSATSLSDVHTGYVWTSPSPVNAIGSGEPAVNMHEVHVCGLMPAKTYYYQVGGGPTGQEVWSATQSFTTLPATGAITVGMLGDARDESTTWQLVNQRMQSLNVAAILFSGDLVLWGTQESLYTTWLDAIWKDPSGGPGFLTLGQIMLLPIAGNHENEAVQFYSAFSIPGDGTYAKAYNSFNIGSAHIVMIDDQPIAQLPGGTEATAQLAWLDQDLAAANADRANHPFIVAMAHRGVFSTSQHSADVDVLQARTSLVPLYDKYHVDMVFAGHDHEYERSYPVTAGSPISGPPVVVKSGPGTTYIISAGAGADPYAVGAGMFPYRAQFAQFCPGNAQATCSAPAMDKAYIGVYGTLTINGTSLTFKAYGLKGAGGADDMLDTVTLTH